MKIKKTTSQIYSVQNIIIGAVNKTVNEVRHTRSLSLSKRNSLINKITSTGTETAFAMILANHGFIYSAEKMEMLWRDNKIYQQLFKRSQHSVLN